MGSGASRREPEVHVVVVQSKDDGHLDARVLRQQPYKGNTASSSSTAGTSSPENDASLHDESLVGERHQRPTRLSLMSESEVRGHRHRQERWQRAVPGNGHQQHQQRHARPVPPAAHRVQQRTFLHQGRLEPQPRRGSEGTVTCSVDLNRATPKLQHNAAHTPPSNEQGKDMMFELFRMFDGEEYTVYLREDGRRFYVDWEEQKWRHFPSDWFQKGKFESLHPDPKSSKSSDVNSERCGEFIHPTRGKLVTFMIQETLNVMYYFDDRSGTWLPMPITWERHTPTVSKMVDEIQRTCPELKDSKSIVAMLRQCNYSADDTASVFLLTNDDGMLDSFKDLSTGHNALVEKLQKRITELEANLDECQTEKQKLKQRITSLKDEMEDLQADNRRLKRELETRREEQHRQSRLSLSQSMGRGRMSVGRAQIAAMKPLIQGVGQEARALKFKLNSTRSLLVKSIKNHNEQMQKLAAALKDMLKRYRAQASDIEEARALYRKEALQRKLLYNEIQELRGNIRVFCRCRYDSSGPCAPKFQEEDKVTVTTTQGRLKTYEFEKTYSPDTSQEQVFEDTKPIITSCVDGYNVCIIAYGQTGAGKTYTMMGPPDNPGVNIRSLEELFKIMNEREKIRFTMRVSMVEVYNEAVYDLLVPANDVHMKLQIQQRGTDTVVLGLTETEVHSLSDVMRLMMTGENNRTTASTKMNTNSSRSHLLLMLRVTAHDTVSMATTHGRLTLVDLAGSERISRSEAVGQRLVEAAAINKSLSALGQVFASIRDTALHIPYRNSKLTHLLQPCIGGHSKACMFVNISPLQSNLAETVSTLEFGAHARQVALGKATKHVTKHQLPAF